MKKLFLLLFISSGLSAQEISPEISRRIDSIFSDYRATGPGCALAVVRDGKMIFAKGYGLASLDYDIPNTPATVFDIASVSKQFAAFAVSYLVEQKKIALQDDIRKYIPEVPDFGKTITISHLVHHTSGLRDWTETLAVAGWRGEEVYSMDDIMRMLKRQKDLDFLPGSKYQYSNTGYNLLAVLVERVTGQTFRDWTAEHIFTPLGMASTQFLDNHRMVIRNMAYSYIPVNDSFAKANSQLTALGSSSLFTTVSDFSKWMIHFMQSLREGKPVYRRMLETGTLDNGEKITYAFGLVAGQYRGLQHVSHTGSWAGYRSVSNYYPDQNFGVVVLSNHAFFSRGKADLVADLFLKDQLKPATGIAAATVTATDRTVAVDTALMRQYTGLYKLGPGWLLQITLENGTLMTRATDEDKYLTEAKNDSSFWVPAYGAALIFNRDPQGRISQLRYKAIQAKRIQPFTPDPVSFKAYEGDYYSAELSTIYRVYTRENKLFLEHMRQGEHQIRPTGKDEFFANRIGELQFTRAGGKVTGFTLSAGRIRNLRFVKQAGN